MPLVHPVRQVTPYTCVLACVESVLHDAGTHVKQEEMLRHHWDLCTNPQKETFGALDESEFVALCRRLGYEATPIPQPDAPGLEDLLKRVAGIVAIVSGHAYRLARVHGGNAVLMNPDPAQDLWVSMAVTDLSDSESRLYQVDPIGTGFLHPPTSSLEQLEAE